MQTEDGLGIAVDVGTTTVAIQLFDLRAGTELGSHTAANHQSAYGADVIARITASTQGKGEELRALIRADLTEGIRSLLTKAQRDPSEVKRMVLAANTTMVHLLMGYSCWASRPLRRSILIEFRRMALSCWAIRRLQTAGAGFFRGSRPM